LNCVLSSLFGGVWAWLLLVNRVVVLYFVGWFGMRQAEVFLPVAVAAVALAHAPVAAETPVAAAADVEKYARSGMTDAAQALISTQLRARMTQARDFLESDLTLSELAERIGTSPQLLSQYLNDTLEMSFFDYINGLRVAEVQRLMADPAHAPETLLNLAFAAGFNSKSTFNAAFRKIGGTTPSEWRRLHIRTPEPIR
jgi:AraC-like DNA-binding protein